MSSSLLKGLEDIDLTWQQHSPLAPHQLIAIHEANSSPEEIAELLAADSEWRWREAGLRAKAVDEPWQGPDDLRPRTVETYLQVLPHLEKADEVRLRLIEAEFVARSRWAQPPRIDDFAMRFPDLPDLDSHLRACLDELSTVGVQLSGPDVAKQTAATLIPVRTPLSLGRRAANEPEGALLLPGRQRLIVARNDRHNVSRKHGYLVRQSLDCCLVANTSSQGEMFLNGARFSPGWQQEVLLPLTIDIGETRLVFGQTCF